ncbi:hypothetical protein AMS68_006058 [Peltaster fructicola]|uniref:Cyclin N-terminal domain-containing protein n=1 Tax=Peltaster fructicola TaxID=286661 RepID=A0A6H0Y0U3_9PEZI|nr:hypothetical protein AMS68_006058 [Peltaster fructicola]
MTLQGGASIVDGPTYEPSVISSTSTSQTSVFSDDAASEQSSVASCSSDDFRQEDTRYCTSTQSSIDHPLAAIKVQQPTYADVTSVPLAQRQHPRRSSLARNQKPPPLLRQADRKLNFVDSLVDSATQMVEVIWPSSMIHCSVESGAGRGVLPLRNYIEETLRRSRTSYSTLQVALYYLILIKPYIPRRDDPSESSRVLVCGRRMFLAALILASKYLQDRNYSAKAWSKMSGLKIAEINANERVFLQKINWKLHVAKPVFDLWTEIVLKYTPSSHPPSPSADGLPVLCWKSLIPVLTPELDGIPLPGRPVRDVSPATLSAPAFVAPLTPTPSHEGFSKMQLDPASEDTTPTPATISLPKFLEPKPTLLPPTPGLVRMGPLPTPQMTPSSVAASTPAASACNSRRPSICSAMSVVQRFGINRCVNEEFPFPSMDKFTAPRRTSVISLGSTRSSPESMITDLSRSSRASSISSVTTMSSMSACSAPRRTNLARLATTRNVRLPVSNTDEKGELEGSAARPITILEENDEAELTPLDFAVNEKKLHAPHRHSKHAPHAQHAVHPAEKSRKRHRHSRGHRRSDLYDEVRYQLEEEEDDDAMVIDLATSDEDMTSPSPAASNASLMLRRTDSSYQAKESQPPASLSRSQSGRIPLSRHDGSKRTCYSSDTTFDPFHQKPLYMEIA